MDFNKWLKKNIATEGMFYNSNLVRVKDLGEWAWDNLKDCEEIESYFDQLSSNDNDKINLASIEEFSDHGDFICLYWEIAIACLGLNEVVKRLKKVEKS